MVIILIWENIEVKRENGNDYKNPLEGDILNPKWASIAVESH
jgi:hypothetical protein